MKYGIDGLSPNNVIVGYNIINDNNNNNPLKIVVRKLSGAILTLPYSCENEKLIILEMIKQAEAYVLSRTSVKESANIFDTITQGSVLLSGLFWAMTFMSASSLQSNVDASIATFFTVTDAIVLPMYIKKLCKLHDIDKYRLFLKKYNKLNEGEHIYINDDVVTINNIDQFSKKDITSRTRIINHN